MDFNLNYKPQFIEAEVIDALKQIESNSIDCIITSPPYYQQVDYEVQGQIGLEVFYARYLTNMSDVFKHLFRVLKDGSVFWLIVNDTVNNYSPIRTCSQQKARRKKKANEWGHRRPRQSTHQEKEQLNIPFHLIEKARRVGFMHRSTLIWDKGRSGIIPQKTDGATNTHEYILQFGKWCKRGRPQLKYKGCSTSVVQCNAVSHFNHAAPFPKELIYPFLIKSTDVGDVVLDPFVGTGTTCIVAAINNRQSIGIDLNVSIAQQEWKHFLLSDESR